MRFFSGNRGLRAQAGRNHHFQRLQVAYWGMLCAAVVARGAAGEPPRSQDASSASSQNRLGVVLELQGDARGAANAYRSALRLQPDSLEAANNLAWLLATSPHGEVRDGQESLQLALQVCRSTNPPRAELLDTLAAAYAECGRYAEAVATLERAIELAAADPQLIDELQSRRRLYARGFSYREPAAVERDAAKQIVLRNVLADAVRAFEQQQRAAEAPKDLIWILASHPSAHARDGETAVQLANLLLAGHEASPVELLDALAAAYAESGRFSDACLTINRAIRRADEFAADRRPLVQRRNLYRAALAFRSVFPTAPERSAAQDETRPQRVANAFFVLATELRASGDQPGSLIALQSAMRLNPQLREAYRVSGEILLHGGQPAAAARQFAAAAKLSPHNAGLLHLQAVALESADQFAEAIAVYRQALEVQPENAAAANNLSWLLATADARDLRDGPEALRLARLACEHAAVATPELYDTLAAAAAEAGDFPAAIAAAEQALARLRTGDDALRAEIEVRLDGYRRGLAYHAAAVEHIARGNRLLTSGEVGQAAEAFLAALLVRENDAATGHKLGVTFELLGQPAKAAAAYRQALKFQPNLQEAANNLAWLLATCADESVRNSGEALQLAQRVCRMTEGQHPQLLDTLAAAHAAAGDYDRAADLIDQAVALLPLDRYADLRKELLGRKELYLAQQPYVETPTGWSE